MARNLSPGKQVKKTGLRHTRAGQNPGLQGKSRLKGSDIVRYRPRPAKDRAAGHQHRRPGGDDFGGQSYIPTSTAKIARLRGMLDAIGSTAELEVDGGIKPGNAAEVVAAGATVLVAGSAIFGGPGTVADNVAAFQAALPL